ncbi:hypothetical protein KJ966_05195 [bacterium]|nr:hypothetical protein [bacterium]
MFKPDLRLPANEAPKHTGQLRQKCQLILFPNFNPSLTVLISGSSTVSAGIESRIISSVIRIIIAIIIAIELIMIVVIIIGD